MRYIGGIEPHPGRELGFRPFPLLTVRGDLPGRLRYGGSAHRWGTAIYVASKNSYEDQIWFSGSTEEIFDLVCDLHVTNAGY